LCSCFVHTGHVASKLASVRRRPSAIPLFWVRPPGCPDHREPTNPGGPQADASTELASNVSSSQESESQPSSDASSKKESQTKGPLNCFDNPLFSLALHRTPETRSQFALDLSKKLDNYDIYVSASGESNKYLLFAAVPENESALRQLAGDLIPNPSVQANWCSEGFAQVQFVIRDADSGQKLISKYKTNGLQTVNYVRQRGGATPVG
jgi:hypothetical protein